MEKNDEKSTLKWKRKVLRERERERENARTRDMMMQCIFDHLNEFGIVVAVAILEFWLNSLEFDLDSLCFFISSSFT